MSEPLHFGLVPVHDDEPTREALGQLTAALTKRLGPCVPVCCESPRELATRFEAGELQLVWSSPTLALTALSDAVPLVASVRQGVAYYHGVLFVLRDSEIRGPMDARGRHVAWVAESSAAGYLFARVALASLGLELDDFFGEESFLGSHGAVSAAVLEGRADIGATFAVFEDGDATRAVLRAGFTDHPKADEARILFSTPPVPSDLIVVSRGALKEHGPRLREALLVLPDELPDAVTQVTGADGFQACRERFLEQLRHQLEDARVLGLIA